MNFQNKFKEEFKEKWRQNWTQGLFTQNANCVQIKGVISVQIYKYPSEEKNYLVSLYLSKNSYPNVLNFYPPKSCFRI